MTGVNRPLSIYATLYDSRNVRSSRSSCPRDLFFFVFLFKIAGFSGGSLREFWRFGVLEFSARAFTGRSISNARTSVDAVMP